VCVCILALVTQYASDILYYNVICCLPGSTPFFQIIPQSMAYTDFHETHYHS